MGSKTFTPQIQCPELLNQHALQLSFTLLREINPALALRIRNATPASDDCHALSRCALPRDCVREVVATLSQCSKQDDLATAAELVTLRKLLLIWMEYQRQQSIQAREIG